MHVAQELTDSSVVIHAQVKYRFDGSKNCTRKEGAHSWEGSKTAQSGVGSKEEEEIYGSHSLESPKIYLLH